MALSYSKTHTTSMMRRLTCTRDGDFNSMTWYKEGSGSSGGFTVTGDTSEANRFSKVTVKTPQVTATGWSSLGSTSYRVYCTLHTSFGDYRTPTTTLTWDEDNGNRTLTFTFDNVLGEWTHFSVWANQDTYTTTNGPYLYWFNNNSGTITVTYAESTNSDENTMSGIGANGEGKWVAGKYYVWKSSNPTTYFYPEAAMTSANSQNCVVKSSSQQSGYQNYKAFNKLNLNGGDQWAASESESQSWLQITIPRKLYNIKVKIYNCNNYGVAAGTIYGSNDGGTTLTEIGSFSGRTTTSRYFDTIVCNNSTVAYDTIRVLCTQKATDYPNYEIGEMLILGEDIGPSGAWVEANPLVWKTENPKTYTYPELSMNSYVSQGCFVTMSTDRDGYNAFKAFDNSNTTFWATTSGTNHWIQITIPRKLYNIQVTISNRGSGSNNNGVIDGIIYGSNDNGKTLTQIGSFSGLSPNVGVTNTITCNNTNQSFETVKISFTKYGDNSGNPITTGTFVLGGISISGTDIGTNGGWVGKIPTNIVTYPKTAMNNNHSKDCVAKASSEYSSSYQAYMAFNKSISTSVKPFSPSASNKNAWIQITMPKPLYNIQFVLCNRYDYNKADGVTDGIIYGSNDEGQTLTEIGTVVDRSPAFKAGSTIICNNYDTAYSTIRLKVTGSNGVVDFSISEIYIIGMEKI